MRVVVLGASSKPDRTSFSAVQQLLSAGHEVIPVHPAEKEILGIKVVSDLKEVKKPVHTLTVYVGPDRIVPTIPAIVALKPERVIMNPGAESQELSEALEEADIPFEEACTLVLLRTHQF